MSIVTELDMSLTDRQYERIYKLIGDSFGIVLGPDKKALIRQRLQKLVRKSNMDSADAWFKAHLIHPSRQTLDGLANVLTTNHTFFWREHAHFEHFRDHFLPSATRNPNASDLRVWCAAASTGEEPWQLGGLIRQHLTETGLGHWKGGLLATDISERALTIAKRGEYKQADVAKMPKSLATRMFDRGSQPELLSIKAALRKEVVFRRFNLMNESYQFRVPFQAIFCRNVMIYFDPPTLAKVTRRLYDTAVPGAMLYVGLSERVTNEQLWQYTAPGIYRRR